MAHSNSPAASVPPLSKLKVQAVMLLLLALMPTSCNGTSKYEVVKSPRYPHLPAGTKSFQDNPVHGPVVAVQVWYSATRIFGFQTTSLDKYRRPIRGYAVGNTSSVTFDPVRGYFLTVPGIDFGNLGGDGDTGAFSIGFMTGSRTETVARLQTANQPVTSSDQTAVFGVPVELAAEGYGPPGVVLGLTGSADHAGMKQLGILIQPRPLDWKQSPSAAHGRGPKWLPKDVVRADAIPRLPGGLREFDDGEPGKHGQVVKVQLWFSPTLGVLGIESTFQDGHRAPLHGYAQGQSTTVTFDRERNPLVALGGRGGPFSAESVQPPFGEYRLGGVAFFSGGTSPPTRTPIIGIQEARTYSDSADGKVVGFFGKLSNSSIAQLGVYVVSPANGLLVRT